MGKFLEEGFISDTNLGNDGVSNSLILGNMVLGVRAFSLSKHTLSPGDAPLDVIGNPSCG